MISRLQYITNGNSENEITSNIEKVLEAGIDWVQLRIKNETIDFYQVAKQVKSICSNRATLIINDRVDIALKIDADGVHLGKDDMSISDARKILGNTKIIGGTANTIVDCKNLENEGVNYIGLGPFKETNTKQNLSPVLGLAGYQKIIPKEESYGWTILSINSPIVAIGGIKLNDVDELLKVSALHGIAVSGLIEKSNNKTELINELKNKLSWKN